MFLLQRDPPQELRPYQRDAVNAAKDGWFRRKARILSLATGAGKTTIAAQAVVEVLKPETERCLFLVHTEELVYQIRDRVQLQYGYTLRPMYGSAPGLGVVMADEKDHNARIIIASRQTLQSGKRLQAVLSHGVIDILIVDECHHISPNNSYHKIVQSLKDANPDIRLLGVTATPYRADKKALQVVFDEIGYTWSLLDGIRDGYLVPPTRIRVRTRVDMRGIKMRAGDYASEELLGILEANNWIDLAISAYFKYFGETNRQVMAFFPSIAQSKMFAEELNKRGVLAAHVGDDTPKSKKNNERLRLREDFAAGKIRVMCSMDLYREGVDIPRTDGILWCRPTKNKGVFIQCIGRGVRLFPGKKDCLVIELATEDVFAVSVGELVGGKLRKCENKECRADFWLGLPACPVCGQLIPPPEPKEEELESDNRLLGAMIETENGGDLDGIGLIDEVLSIFDTMKASWHTDQHARQSASLGFGCGALFIMPPDRWDAEARTIRLRERIGHGLEMLADLETAAGDNLDDANLRVNLLEQIGLLEAEMSRIKNYSVYHVTEDKKVAFIRSEGDLNHVVAMADLDCYALAGAAFNNEAAKLANWRKQEASPKQWDLLHGLKRDRAVRMAQCIPAEVPANISMGHLSAIISHAILLPALLAWIEYNTLPEPEQYSGPADDERMVAIQR